MVKSMPFRNSPTCVSRKEKGKKRKEKEKERFCNSHFSLWTRSLRYSHHPLTSLPFLICYPSFFCCFHFLFLFHTTQYSVLLILNFMFLSFPMSTIDIVCHCHCHCHFVIVTLSLSAVFSVFLLCASTSCMSTSPPSLACYSMTTNQVCTLCLSICVVLLSLLPFFFII